MFEEAKKAKIIQKKSRAQPEIEISLKKKTGEKTETEKKRSKNYEAERRNVSETLLIKTVGEAS